MEFTGEIIRVEKQWQSNSWTITFSVNEEEALYAADSLKDKLLRIVVKKFSKKRSIDANSLLWKCITDIALALKIDKWDVYIQKLKEHGRCYPATIPKVALNDFVATWRAVEIVGEWTDEDGYERVSILCYPGSHLYTSDEFSRLLSDVIEDMKEQGIQPPTSEEMRRSIEEWEKLQKSKAIQS